MKIRTIWIESEKFAGNAIYGAPRVMGLQTAKRHCYDVNVEKFYTVIRFDGHNYAYEEDENGKIIVLQ